MKRNKKTLFSMLLVFCLMFTMASAATVFAGPETTVPETVTPQPVTPQPESETEKPEPETEEIKGFENPVTYVIKGHKVKLKTVGITGKRGWKSSKKKVATVNKKGFVTGLKKGRTNVTVYAGKVPYTCKVIVETPAISNQSINLLSGTTFQLSMAKTKQEVEWKSSNKKIAAVDEDGLVTAKKKGTATIIAQIGKVKYQCKVTVEEPTISQKTLSIKAGETAKLSVYGTSKAVKWSSKDKGIASVKAGVVKAKKIGTTTIVATVGDKVMKCEVTVQDNPIKSVKLSDSTLTLTKGEEKVLKAQISPETTNASKKITWTTSDEAIAKVNSEGKVTAIGVGTATIKAEAGGKTDTCKVTVKPSMSMKYADIVAYVQKNGKYNAEGNMEIVSKITTASGSPANVIFEVNRSTGKLSFGYDYTGQYNSVKISMVVDVPKTEKLTPTVSYVTTNQKTSYKAVTDVNASAIRKGGKLTWKMYNATDKAQELAIQTTCNSKFNEALTGWQTVLKATTGYELAEIGFINYK